MSARKSFKMEWSDSTLKGTLAAVQFPADAPRSVRSIHDMFPPAGMAAQFATGLAKLDLNGSRWAPAHGQLTKSLPAFRGESRLAELHKGISTFTEARDLCRATAP
jgi:hypothetical protein